jgi:hypothetical protein
MFRGKGGGGWAEWRQITRICWDGEEGDGRRVQEKRGRITRKDGISRRKLLRKMGHNRAVRNRVKVKVTLVQATKGQTGSRDIVLLFL